MLLAASGCSSAVPMNGSIPNRLSGSFTSELTMTAGETESKATLTRYGTDAWCVVFSEPKAISGVQLDLIDGDIKASYKGLEFSVPKSAQAVKTHLIKLMDAVESYAAEPDFQNVRQKEKTAVLEGELPEGGYTLTLNTDGTPLNFTLPCYDLSITFDSFAESSTAPSTAPSEPIVQTETISEEGTQ